MPAVRGARRGPGVTRREAAAWAEAGPKKSGRGFRSLAWVFNDCQER